MAKNQRQDTTKIPKVTEAAELTEEDLAKISGGDGDTFLTLGGIKGEETVKDHKGSII